MAGERVADWREDAAAAVDIWIASEGRGGRRPRRRDLGEARPEGDGWVAVDLRGRQLHPDQLDGLRLVPPGGGDADRVVEAVPEGEIPRARVARHVGARG